jgi:hypothetical protein
MANSLDLADLLGSLLAEPLQELGFKRAQRLIFQREASGVRQFLRFPTRLHNNIMFFNVNAAVRFEEIEKLLGNVDPLSPTLMMPVHLLRPNKEYHEWQFTPDYPGVLVDKVLADCRHYLLPLIEKMSVLETLKSQLVFEIDHFATVAAERAQLNSEAERIKYDVTIQNNGRLKLVLSPEQRVEKLAAIYVLEGKRDAAEHLIDAELAKLRIAKPLTPHIASRLRWEKLKKTLLGEKIG